MTGKILSQVGPGIVNSPDRPSNEETGTLRRRRLEDVQVGQENAEGELAGLSSRTSLQSMPMEVVNEIVKHLPHRPGSKVTSLAMTSRKMYGFTVRQILPKAKASRLIGRAEAIKHVPVDQNAAFERAYEPRLAEFKAIIAKAMDAKVKLSANELSDVFIALARELHNTGYSKPEAFELMLKYLEGLGHEWNQITANDPVDRQEQQFLLDGTKCTMIALLSYALRTGGNDVNRKNGYFDRVYKVLESIQTPSVKSRAAFTLPLSEWYFYGRNLIDTPRFQKLFDFVEKNIDDLSDVAKRGAVITLTPKIENHQHDGDKVSDFNRSINIASSIKDDKTKADVTAFLFGELDLLGAGDAKTSASARLDEVVSSIKDPSERAWAADAKFF